MHLKSLVSLVSIIAFLLTSTPFALAETIDTILKESWQGKTQTELVTVWGQPTNFSNLPNSSSYWINYES
jgi:hypothetical protein